MTGDLAVVLAPAAAWSRAKNAIPAEHWLSRYLLLMVVTGCAASLMTSGRLTLRIAIPCMLYTAVVPALQIGSLAAVNRGSLPLRRAAALFAIGNLPWMLVLTGVAAAWAWAPAPAVYRHFNLFRNAAPCLLFAYGAYVDYWFFRRVLGRAPSAAVRDLAIQRLLCWGVGMTFWVGPAGWQVISSAVGL